jgi:hypothetical protein
VSTRFRLALDAELALDVRRVSVREALNQPFTVSLVGLSAHHDADVDDIIGCSATLRIADHERLGWSGLVSEVVQLGVTDGDEAIYELSLVPRLWLLTQRRNHRVFQALSEPAVALALLESWNIEPDVHVDLASYKRRDICVQYGESDFAFLSRMLVRDVDLRLASDAQPLISSECQDASPIERRLERFHYVPGAALFESEGADTPVADDRLAVRSAGSRASGRRRAATPSPPTS